MSTEISFEVNGEDRQFTGDGTTPLLLVLRNDLGMRGTQHGCATGDCGVCTVLVDGRAQTSCNTPIEAIDAIDAASIETIEKLGADNVGKALLAAFVTEQAGQCCYCLAGILNEAKALLTTTLSPTRSEIAAALDGHLCRCGAHQRILNAIERCAAELAGEQGE